jgi:hypothetical protein
VSESTAETSTTREELWQTSGRQGIRAQELISGNSGEKEKGPDRREGESMKGE